MEENEIMMNDEFVTEAEEIVEESSGKGFKVVAGIGLVALAGGLAYKFVAKPLIAKFKAKKEEQNCATVEAEYVVTDSEPTDDQENGI